jgi:hypothetical protein
LQIAEVGVASTVHARAQIDQAAGRGDERGEQVGREHVDGEHVLEPVRGGVQVLAIADAGVVDNRVQGPRGVCLFGDRTGLGDAREVAYEHAQRLGHGLGRLGRPLLAARVQQHLMTRLD